MPTLPMLLSGLLCTPFALVQLTFAIICLRQYRSARVPAIALIIVAPLQVLAATFGRRLLMAILPNTSGFGGAIFEYVAFVIGGVVLSTGICVWLSLSLDSQQHRMPKN